MENFVLSISPTIWAAIIGAIGVIVAAVISRANPWAIFAGLLVGIVVGFGGGLAVSKMKPGAKPPLTLKAPFDISSYFYPSGWMGDGELGTKHIQLNDAFKGHPRPGDPDQISIKVSYQPGVKVWAGIYWQYPASNWGDHIGRTIQGATTIIFWARGDKGGELVEFKAGGISDPSKAHRDSFEVSRGRVHLTKEWKKYMIDLKDKDLSHVIGAFAWVTNRNMNPEGLTFYLDDLRYE